MSTITTTAATITTSRAARITGWVITAYVTLFLGVDAIGHLLQLAPYVDSNKELGFPSYYALVSGAVLAASLVVYHLPRTRVLGAALLVAYLGGAVAVNLYLEQPAFNTIFAVLHGVLVVAGLWPRDARLRGILQKP